MTVGVGDIVRITAKMKLFGTDDVQNVFTFRVDANTTPDDDAFMDDVAAFIDGAYNLVDIDQSTFLTYQSVDGQNLTKNELLPEKNFPILVAGLQGGDLLPTQVAPCVFWPTITPKVRTSSFLGGYTEFNNTSIGEITGTGQSNLLSFGLFLASFVGVRITLRKGSLNPLTMVFTVAGTARVPARWRTQRRRRIGVGS